MHAYQTWETMEDLLRVFDVVFLRAEQCVYVVTHYVTGVACQTAEAAETSLCENIIVRFSI